MDLRSPRPKINFLSAESGISQDLSKYVVSFQTQKHMNQLAGSFQIVMSPKFSGENNVSYYDALSFIYRNVFPMDLISFGMNENGSMMLGIVDNVTKSRTIMNNQVGRSIVIRGRDFGKMLVEDNSFFAPANNGAFLELIKKKLVEYKIVSGDQKLYQHPLANLFNQNRAPVGAGDSNIGNLSATFFTRNVKEAIEWVLKSLTSLRINVYYDGRKDVPVFELLDTKIEYREGDQIATDQHNSYNGSIGNLLYNLIDRDFYELFIETWQGKARFIVRPKPYDRTNDKVAGLNGQLINIEKEDKWVWDSTFNIFDGKEYKEISEQDIINIGLGVSDYETFSVYLHNARSSLVGHNFEQAGMFFPSIDFYALKRFGLKVLKTDTNLIPMSLDTDGKIKEQDKIENRICAHRDRLWNWNRYNSILESGSVSIRGNEFVKLGDKIKLKDEIAKNGGRGILAYCVGYSHRWQWGTPFITTINLIRGENEKLLNSFKEKTNDMIIRAKTE